MLAYLVIREGSKWTDVFRLVPGQTVTVGRAPTNQIVIKDERCSRCHAELFQSEGRWTLRDLDSRNGTIVGDGLVRGDVPLTPGDVIRIGRSQLAFVDDLSKAFPETGVRRADPGSGRQQRPAAAPGGRRSSGRARADDDHPSPRSNEISRAGRRRRRRRIEGRSRRGKALPAGVRAGQEPRSDGHGQAGDRGLVRRNASRRRRVVAVATRLSRPRPRRSKSSLRAPTPNCPTIAFRRFWPPRCLREGEAVLARNIMGDSTVSSRDSKGEIHATSVICAPIRRGRTIFGLIHLYSTNPARVPDPDDLEFTLAVADTVAVALQNLHRRQELAENLNQIRDENLQLRERLGVQSEIVGNSPAITQHHRRDRPRGASECHGADSRRKRRGQRAGGPRRAFLQPAEKRAVRLRQLRGPGRKPAGKRIVRPRARRVHRRRREEDRQIRGSRTRAR